VDRKSRRKAARQQKKASTVPPTTPPQPPVPPKTPIASNDPPDHLTPRERRFVEEYIADPNATQAYRRAFKVASYTTCANEGNKLKKNPIIAEEIAAARDAQSKRTRITADRTLREIARIAFADVRDLFSDDSDDPRLLPVPDMPLHTRRAIQSVKVKRSKIYGAPGEGPIGEEDIIEVKLASKDAAIGRLMKHLGLAKEMMPLDAFLALLPEPLRRQLAEAMAGAHAPPDVPAGGGGGTGEADADGEDS